MVHIKRMNEEYFAKLLKDLTASGELIRARQEEKQKLLDSFNAESKRFFFGKISQRGWQSSVKKTNLELQRLDKNRRDAIKSATSHCDRTRKLCVEQMPIGYKATLTGISDGKRKKKVVRRKVAKKTVKKVVKKKK
ncbi:MAG: hypothetical protein KJ566_00195 [Nanoarchaeota archaeon]|nr:hypothetical protein [Nanoarchaeota archaeon]